MQYRLGVIGTGRIAKRFVNDAWQECKADLISVYNPHRMSAEHFVIENGLINLGVKGTDQWDEFLESIDAVYIASPHETHYEYAKYLLQNGKHVLCEKPMCLKKKEVEELFLLAEKNNLILMEAMKTIYFPAFLELMEVIRSKKIGEIIEVEATSTKICPSDSRECQDSTYGGSITEMGAYVFYPIAKILGINYKDIRFWSRKGRGGVDAYSHITMDYGDTYASCKVAVSGKSEGQLIVAGTKGYIIVKSPWWLTKEFDIRYEDPNVIDHFECSYQGSGLSYETKEFFFRIEQMKRKDVSLWDRRQEDKTCASFVAEIIEKFLHERAKN